MTRNEILRRYPNASESFIKANLTVDTGDSRTIVQKPQADCAGPQRQIAVAGDKEGRKEMDEHDDGKYRVTITVRCSDRIRRDLDGCAATLLDCLINATGRCTADHR